MGPPRGTTTDALTRRSDRQNVEEVGEAGNSGYALEDDDNLLRNCNTARVWI
jgi:hypothetical protein